MPGEETKQWYILSYIPASLTIARKKPEDWIERFNTQNAASLQIFAPRFIKLSEKDKKKSVVPLTFHYVFVKGDLAEVKKLCASGLGFVFVLNKCKQDERYATISEEQMLNFKIIASHFSNSLPYYSLENINLEEGDLVEVIEGDFPGLVGHYFPKPRSTYGNILLQVSQNLGTVAYNINVKSLRILRFAKNFKRSYDQIDAIVPKLLEAERKVKSGESLSEKEITDLSLFFRRMESVKLDSSKVEAKLLGILLATDRVLGNIFKTESIKKRFDKKIQSVTNPSTLNLLSQLGVNVLD